MTSGDGEMLAAWRERVNATSLNKQTLGGLAIEPLYVSAPAGARIPWRSGPTWRVAVELSAPDPRLAGQQAERARAEGADELCFAAGPEHGVRVLAAGDLALVLESVDLELTHLSLTPEGDGLGLMAALVAVAESRGVARGALRGGLGVDPLGRLARLGSLTRGVRGARQELVDVADFARRELPRMRALRVDVCPHHEAGAHAIGQLSWALATGVAYLRVLVDAGFTADEAAGLVEFALPITPDLLMEVAKLRALRRIWAKAVAAVGGSPAVQRAELLVRGARRTRSRYDRWTNQLRVSYEGLAAALGGADSVSLPPWDEALGTREPAAARAARMAHHVLREEAHLARVADPLAGSHALETLTERLAEAAWDGLRDIEARGGMFAEARGRVRKQTQFVTEARWQRLSTRRQSIVGVSRFANLDEEALPKGERPGADFLHELGRRLPNGSPDEIQAALLDWARLLAEPELAVGRLADQAVISVGAGVDLFSLRALLEEGRPGFFVEPLHPWRDAEGFETYRDASETMQARQGRRPTVLLLTLGPQREHEARAAFFEGLAASGGVRVRRLPLDDELTPEAIVAASEGMDGAVLCGTDGAYAALGVEAARDLFSRGVKLMGRVGRPLEDADAWVRAGLVHSFYEGADAMGMLAALWEPVGELA